jgi:hypothetical protein
MKAQTRGDSSQIEGTDAHDMSPEGLAALGHLPKPIHSVIREKCLDCNGSAHEVRLCTVVRCPLWPYRLGASPFRKRRTISPAHAERLRLGRTRLAEIASRDEVR